MAKRGRRRRQGVEREPNGRTSRADYRNPVVPAEALRRRAEANGMDVAKLLTNGATAVAAICTDQAAGTAMGRLTWRFASDGGRIRRMADFGTRDRDGGTVLEPVITDDMAMGADTYRKLWATWHYLTGLPRRHPQGQQFDRHDRGHEPVMVGCKRSPENRECGCPVCRVSGRLRVAEEALRRCSQHVLVWTVVEAVVIEDQAPDSLVLGERSAALRALRRGLEALHAALCAARSKKRIARTLESA